MGRQLLSALAPAALTLVWAVGVSAFAQSPAQPPSRKPAPRQQAKPTQPQPPTHPLPPDIADHDSMHGAGNPQTYPNMPISRPTH